MKKIFSILFTAVLVLMSAGTGFSHGPDSTHHAASMSDIETKSKKVVADLVEKGKLDKSWNGVTDMKIKHKDVAGTKEWMAVLVNDNEKDRTKKTLYIFFTLNGEYLATNFTGK